MPRGCPEQRENQAGESGRVAMASPQQSAQAVATFLGRAGRLAVFAGLGGAALQAALYTGVALCLHLSWPPFTSSRTRGNTAVWDGKVLPISAEATCFSTACGTRTAAPQTTVFFRRYACIVSSHSAMDAPP